MRYLMMTMTMVELGRCVFWRDGGYSPREWGDSMQQRGQRQMQECVLVR